MSMKDNKDLNTVRGQIVTLSNQVVLKVELLSLNHYASSK